jgi:hypothetical protein
MNTTNSRLIEMRKHRAIVAGEYLGEAILALSRWVSRVAHAWHTPRSAGREQAHSPR